jgi:hypothetical protein
MCGGGGERVHHQFRRNSEHDRDVSNVGAIVDLDLIINAADPRLSGLLSIAPNNQVARGIAPIAQTVRGDQLDVRVRLETPSVSGQRQFDDVDISAATVTAAIGLPDQVPLAGTFFLKVGNPATSGLLATFKRYQILNYVSGDDFTNVGASSNASGVIFIPGGVLDSTVSPTNWSHGSSLQEITTDLNSSALVTDVGSALNATNALTVAGGVSVMSPSSGVFFVMFTLFGAQTLLGGDGSKLIPLSGVSTSRAQTGTSSVYEIQMIRLLQNPYCAAVLSTPFPASGSVVTNLQTGTVSAPSIQRLALTPAPYAGTFSFVLGANTYVAPYNASQTAMQAIVGWIATVTQTGQFQWDFAFNSIGSQTAIAVNVSGLSVPIGVSGVLLLNTIGLYQAFIASGANILTLTLEVKFQWANSLPETKLQIPIKVGRNVIDASALVLAAFATLVNVTWIPGLTALTGSSSALDHVAIAGMTTGALIIAEINGSGQMWQVEAGAYDPTDAGQIQTQDYDAVINNRHLAKLS